MFSSKSIVVFVILAIGLCEVAQNVNAAPTKTAADGKHHHGGHVIHKEQSYSCSKGCGMSFDTASERDNHESGCNGTSTYDV